MINAHILIPLFMALGMAAVIFIAFDFPYLQAKLSILFVGGVVFIMALVQLTREISLRKKQLHESGADREAPEREASRGQYLLEAAWMVGFGVTIYLFGFLLAIPFYVCAYMKVHGTRWKVSIVTGALMAAGCYILFIWFFDMSLYKGILFG